MTKIESIGIPSTNQSVWGFTYNPRDRVKIRKDMAKLKNIQYESSANDFIIQSVDVVGNLQISENPTGRIYQLNNNGGGWEGKDLEPYQLPNSATQPKSSTTQITDTPSQIPPTINMEGDFVSNFINKNAQNLTYIAETNKPLFNVIEMTLNFLNERFGTGTSLAEKIEDDIDEVIKESDEMAQKAAQVEGGLIKLKEISVELKRKRAETLHYFKTWSEFQDFIKNQYELAKSIGYDKFRIDFIAKFENSDAFRDILYVSDNDFNPNNERVGAYIDRPFKVDRMNEDLDIYQWEDDDYWGTDDYGDTEMTSNLTEEDIDRQIEALELSLMLEEDQEKIDEINKRIETLNLSKSLI